MNGGERSWIWAAVNRSTTTMGPPHLGQRHSGCAVGAVEVSDSLFGGVAWRAAKHRGSRAARLRLARKPKWVRTRPLGEKFIGPEKQNCRHHPRGSVRRASGFVLTSNTYLIG